MNGEGGVRETDIFDSGVDGVATAEKDADDPRTDEAAAAGDAHHLTPSHTCFLTRHAFSFRYSLSFLVFEVVGDILSHVADLQRYDYFPYPFSKLNFKKRF